MHVLTGVQLQQEYQGRCEVDIYGARSDVTEFCPLTCYFMQSRAVRWVTAERSAIGEDVQRWERAVPTAVRPEPGLFMIVKKRKKSESLFCNGGQYQRNHSRGQSPCWRNHHACKTSLNDWSYVEGLQSEIVEVMLLPTQCCVTLRRASMP
jgi:hypothetical protein